MDSGSPKDMNPKPGGRNGMKQHCLFFVPFRIRLSA